MCIIKTIVPHVFNTTLNIPPSKSHTIRRLIMAALTGGTSVITQPLISADTQSCIAACCTFGTEITEGYPAEAEYGNNGCPIALIVRGQNPEKNNFSISTKNNEFPLHIDAGNSGTTLFFAIAAAALFSQNITFTGDRHIAKRSAGPLLDALAGLGVKAVSKNGYIPITICGPWKGGRVNLPCITSQFLSALLIAAPLAPAGTITEIDVPLLNEKPYIEMTLAYLKSQGLYDGASDNSKIVSNTDYSYFRIMGGNTYAPLNGPVPGDFSSAVFPAAAAALSGGKAVLCGLDPDDTQGDKVFFEYLVQMGCEVQWEQREGDWQVTVFRNGPLRGGVFDLNATPDLLPIMAVLGAFSEGETVLTNAAHARIKETDRIAVMAEELRKLFAGKNSFRCEEKPDGLIITGIGGHIPHSGHHAWFSGSMDTRLTLDGHGDHRITMALACAALGLPAGTRPVTITGAEAADVSYPGFWEMIDGVNK